MRIRGAIGAYQDARPVTGKAVSFCRMPTRPSAWAWQLIEWRWDAAVQRACRWLFGSIRLPEREAHLPTARLRRGLQRRRALRKCLTPPPPGDVGVRAGREMRKPDQRIHGPGVKAAFRLLPASPFHRQQRWRLSLLYSSWTGLPSASTAISRCLPERLTVAS